MRDNATRAHSESGTRARSYQANRIKHQLVGIFFRRRRTRVKRINGSRNRGLKTKLIGFSQADIPRPPCFEYQRAKQAN